MKHRFQIGTDAVAAVELAIVHLHLHSQQTGLHGGGDFGRAAGLCAVTDHAGVDCDGIDDGVGDLAVAPAVQVGDAGARAAASTGRAAIGGQAADAGLQVDGHEVGDNQRPVQHILGHLQLLGVHNDGQRGGQSLVAAAGVDNHRQLTAVHAPVRTGGGVGLGALSLIHI